MKNKILELLGVEKLIDTIQKIIEVRISMIKDEVEEKISATLAKVLPLILFFLSVLALILFCSFTLAFYLAELLKSLAAGFGIVAIIYLIISVVFYVLKDNEGVKDRFKEEIKKRS